MSAANTVESSRHYVDQIHCLQYGTCIDMAAGDKISLPLTSLLVPIYYACCVLENEYERQLWLAQVEKDVNKAIALMEEVETEIGRKKEVRYQQHTHQKNPKHWITSPRHDVGTFSESVKGFRNWPVLHASHISSQKVVLPLLSRACLHADSFVGTRILHSYKLWRVSQALFTVDAEALHAGVDVVPGIFQGCY